MNEAVDLIFKPEGKTIEQLFCNVDSFYQIPNYQRPFSWEDEQIEQLWDDIYSAAEARDENYFLGPIILIKTDKGYFEVVDGQQRITTLTILFCVLRDFFLKNDRHIADAIKSHLNEKYRLRLITQSFYQNQFEQEILNQVKFPTKRLTGEERKHKKYLNAVLIFRQKLAELAETGGPEAIENLSKYIFRNVVVITITCLRQEHAIKLFQVLNSRGLDLTNADLIKSYLFGELEDDQQKDQFISSWEQIETLSREIKETTNDLLTYYQYYLIAKNPERTLFEELKNQFKNKNSNEIIHDFLGFVKSYSAIKAERSKLVYSYLYLPNQVFWKSILTSAKKCEYLEFNDLCKELRKLYYCYWIAGYTTSKIKQISYNLINWIKENKPIKVIAEGINKKLADDNVIKRMKENIEGDVYGYPWLKPLLILIEYNLSDGALVPFVETDKGIHADHILPQGWREIKEWKESWNKETAENWLNKIGNITLLSDSKNIRARNWKFEDKRKIYKGEYEDGYTVFIMSQKVVENSNWTSEEVNARQVRILKEIGKLFGIDFENIPRGIEQERGPDAVSKIAGPVPPPKNPALSEWTPDRIRKYLDRQESNRTYYYLKSLAMTDNKINYFDLSKKISELSGKNTDNNSMGGIFGSMTRYEKNRGLESLYEVDHPQPDVWLHFLKDKYKSIIRSYFKIE